MKIKKVPGLIIIGAAKAGTTALYDLLIQHPDIHFSDIKETLFFSRDDYFQKGLDWYLKTFFADAGDFPVVGEATPHYLYWAEKTAPRIAETLGREAVKFIVCLREPASRAYSFYWNMVREGKEERSFEEALACEENDLQANYKDLYSRGAMTYGYRKGSDYLPQIKTFMRYFDRTQFFFIRQSDIRNPRSDWIKQLLVFLDLGPDFTFATSISNPAKMPRSRTIHRWLHEPSPVKTLVKKIIPLQLRYRLKGKLRDANLRDFAYRPMDPDTEQKLKAQFAPQIQELETITGLDLSDWQ